MMNHKVKYKADTLRIIGLGMFAPAGKLFLNPIRFFKGHDSLEIIINVIIATLGVVFGLKIIARGLKLMEGIHGKHN